MCRVVTKCWHFTFLQTKDTFTFVSYLHFYNICYITFTLLKYELSFMLGGGEEFRTFSILVCGDIPKKNGQ